MPPRLYDLPRTVGLLAGGLEGGVGEAEAIERGLRPITANYRCPRGELDLIMGDGIIRARFRDSDKKEKLMTPGRTYEFTVKLDPCCNVFKKGHRIRLEVSSSNFPRYDRNLNTGGNIWDETEGIVANSAVHHSPEHPSRIVLPIVGRPASSSAVRASASGESTRSGTGTAAGPVETVRSMTLEGSP